MTIISKKDGDDDLNTFEMMGAVTWLLNNLFEFDQNLLPTHLICLTALTHCTWSNKILEQSS